MHLNFKLGIIFFAFFTFYFLFSPNRRVAPLFYFFLPPCFLSLCLLVMPLFFTSCLFSLIFENHWKKQKLLYLFFPLWLPFYLPCFVSSFPPSPILSVLLSSLSPLYLVFRYNTFKFHYNDYTNTNKFCLPCFVYFLLVIYVFRDRNKEWWHPRVYLSTSCINPCESVRRVVICYIYPRAR